MLMNKDMYSRSPVLASRLSRFCNLVEGRCLVLWNSSWCSGAGSILVQSAVIIQGSLFNNWNILGLIDTSPPTPLQPRRRHDWGNLSNSRPAISEGQTMGIFAEEAGGWWHNLTPAIIRSEETRPGQHSNKWSLAVGVKYHASDDSFLPSIV